MKILVAVLLLWCPFCISLAYLPPTPLAPERAASIRFNDEARRAFTAHGITPAQWNLMSEMARSLAAWNERINVVSRVDATENLIARHYLPSLALLNLFRPYRNADTSNPKVEDMTVVQLKEALRAMHLPVTGKKIDLMSMLNRQ